MESYKVIEYGHVYEGTKGISVGFTFTWPLVFIGGHIFKIKNKL